MLRVLHGILLVGICLNLWIALGYMMTVKDAGQEPAFSRYSLLTYLLLIAAPAVTFIPIARLLHAPYYDVEAVAGWSLFGYVLIFTSPDEVISRGQLLVLLLPFTVALATLAALPAYAFGIRMHRANRKRDVFLQARRQGYLSAIVIVALLLLNAFGVLSPFNGTLLVVIACLLEALMQARFGMQQAS